MHSKDGHSAVCLSGCQVLKTRVITPRHHYAYGYKSKGHTSLLGHKQQATLSYRSFFNDNQTGIPQLIEQKRIKYTLTYSSIIVPLNKAECDC